MLRVFAVLIEFGLACSFISLVFALVVIIIYLKGVLLIGSIIAILGLLLINYIFVNILYNFIFERKQYIKTNFIIFIVSLLLLGIGLAISFKGTMNLDIIENSSINYQVYTEDIEISDDKAILFPNSNIVIDNDIDNIKVEVKHIDEIKPIINMHEVEVNDKDYKIYDIYYDYYPFKTVKKFIDNLNDNKIINYEDYDQFEVTIYVNEDNNKLIKNNYIEYYYETNINDDELSN